MHIFDFDPFETIMPSLSQLVRTYSVYLSTFCTKLLHLLRSKWLYSYTKHCAAKTGNTFPFSNKRAKSIPMKVYVGETDVKLNFSN